MDLLPLIIRNLRSRKLRGYLTILGVVIGVTTIVALMSLGDGLQRAVEEQFSAIGSDVIVVFPAGLTGPPAGINGFEKDEVEYVRNLGGTKYSYFLIFQFADVEYKDQEYFGAINGWDMDNVEQRFTDEDLLLDSGRYYDNDEKGVALIGYNLAYEIFDSDILVGTKITIKDKDYRVVGILDDTGGPLDDRVHLPADDMRDLFDTQKANAVNFKAAEGRDLQVLKEDIQRQFERRFDEDEFDVNTQDDLLEQVNQILGIVQGFLVAIASISIVVGAVGIMNSMYTAALERTKEIGIMKAVGAGNGSIAVMYMIESGFLGLIGGLIGFIIGLGIAYIVQLGAAAAGFELLQITISWSMVAEVLLGSTVLGMIFGTLPAYRASKQQPVDALRYE